jgi:hypothetical protein
MAINDITEDLNIDLSATDETSSFLPTNVAYDVTFGDNGFIVKNDAQNPYVRETAQYKKDQFDNSTEPGEQTLTGWWLRSQTSWHEGAGIRYFEPGVEKNVTHRFYDSRGVDVWTIGEASLLPKVFHGYEGSSGIIATAGNDGTNDCLVSGDSAGVLRKIVLNGNSTATATTYTITSHSTHPFRSVSSDGHKYYAACNVAIHTGVIGQDSDVVRYRYTDTPTDKVFIKYVKGYVILGVGNNLYNLYNIATATAGHSGGASDLPGAAYKNTHINSDFAWRDAAAGPVSIYVCGKSKSVSEIWSIGFDDVSHTPDMNNAQMVASMPFGEIVNSIHYYLGYLCVGTNKGVRVCPIGTDGSIVLGPLLYDSEYNVNGFTERGSYIYAATALSSTTAGSNASVVRIDLSNPFEDGTFPYANDLEYESDETSIATDAYNINDRIVMVIEEGAAGQLLVEHTTDRRSSGWLETGFTRYGTTEPKYFKWLNINTEFDIEDSISVTTIDSNHNTYDVAVINNTTNAKDLEIHNPTGKQELLALKFTFNNNSPNTNTPRLMSYRIKAIPGMPRQRLIQYRLSCYDIEQDRYNSQFGYIGRAYDLLTHMEILEEAGDFVLVTDWRTGESYTGTIETMRFENTASSDKNSSGYGGILTITVRKVN